MTDQPLATIKQRNYIGVLFRTRGVEADSDRAAFIHGVTGVETSPGQHILTRAQAAHVITALKQLPFAPLPDTDPFDQPADWQD